MKIFVVITSLFVLSGCASIISGVSQPVSIETRLNGEPVAGVACKLSSNKGTWFVTTPGQVLLHRGFQDLSIACDKPGITPSISVAQSHVKALFFGNLLFGGLIGIAVDLGDGAAFDYDDLISVDMGNGPVVTGMAPAIAPMIIKPSASSISAVSPSTTAASAPLADAAPPLPFPDTSGRTLSASTAQSASVGPGMPAPSTTPVGTLPTVQRKEFRYQYAAEAFAKAKVCSTMPVPRLIAIGPGSETYAIPCVSGETMIARCEFGQCRALE